MIDCGVPYVSIQEYLKLIKCCLISHEHLDHINLATIRTMQSVHKIPVYSNDVCANKNGLKKIGVADILKIKTNNYIYEIQPYILYHNNKDMSICDNLGFLIKRIDLENGNVYLHFHATDSYTLEGINIPKCDSMTLEINHNMEIVNNTHEMKTFVMRGIRGHLEDIKGFDFALKNLKPGGRLFPCHMSERNLIKENIKFHFIGKDIQVIEWWNQEKEINEFDF
jgi:hypothetical protein